MTQPLFLYGTLRDDTLRRIVAGADLNCTPAVLRGMKVATAAGDTWPLITPKQNARAAGAIVTPGVASWRRLNFYEFGFGYRLETCTVDVSGETHGALVYLPERETEAGDDWSLEAWQESDAPLAREAAIEYMRLIDRLDPTAAARAFPQIRSRGASRLRARRSPSPSSYPLPPEKVAVERTEQPYTDYFAVREDWLRFPLFDGGHSETVKRASFLGGDAVTVLPYDPRSGDVMVIRQFRHGPFARGDENPWTLEPVAGRIDAGETPEETATREMEEEAGFRPDALYEIASYYPSPGAYSEWLVSYIALANLSGADRTIGGVDHEAEDIMAHVLPLDALLDMIRTGAANTGPLILSTLWLDANKERLKPSD